MIHSCKPAPSLLALALFFLLLPAVAAAQTASPVAGAAKTPELSFQPVDFELGDDETVPAERGTLRVPENRNDPESRTIELALVRFPSTAEEPGPPIVYLAGGPGGSGIDAARGYRSRLLVSLREHGDVIALDQRGTGESEPEMECGNEYAIPFDRPLDRGSAGATLAVAARSCMERLESEGIDLDGYTTTESADDLEALRRALDAEKLILVGSSYGSHLALATLDRHGERVAGVVLSGIEPLHHTWKLPSDQQRLLGEIARLAAADPQVREEVPDLLGSAAEVLERLRSDPVTVRAVHPLERREMEIVVGELDLQRFLAEMLRGPDEFRALPDSVARMADGDLLGLALHAARFREGGVPWNGMSMAMDCASGISGEWATRIASQTHRTLLADAINFPAPAICAGVPVRDLGEEFREMGESDVPALLLSGSLDGRTPPTNAEEVLPLLPNARHVVVRGAGHSDDLLAGTPESRALVRAFLRGEQVAEETLVVERPPFIPPREVMAPPREALERYVGTYRIAEDDHRRVILAGDHLWTQRGEGPPFPIRPTSPTEFFYEGTATFLRFQLGEEGEATGMVMYPDGGDDGQEAVKVSDDPKAEPDS